MKRYQIHLRRALLCTIHVDAESENIARQYVNKLDDQLIEWEVELPKQIVGIDTIDNPEE